MGEQNYQKVKDVMAMRNLQILIIILNVNELNSPIKNTEQQLVKNKQTSKYKTRELC